MLAKLFPALLLMSGFGASAAGTLPADPATSGLPNPNFGLLKELDLSRLPAGPDGMRIVARVNGRPVSEERFLRVLNRVARTKSAQAGAPAEAMKSAIAAPVLDDLIRSELILEYAEKHGLTASEEEISRALKAANENLPPGRKLQDQAMKRGEAPESVREEIRERLIQNRVVEHLGRDVKAAPAEREAQLLRLAGEAAQSGQPTSATEIRARHIVFRSPSDSPTTTAEQVRARAEKVLELLQGGMDFGQAARRYSQDRATRDLDGDLGYFARGRMYPDFEQAAFALQPGEISGVVRTPVGFHIIQVTDRRESGVQHLLQEGERRRRFSQWLEKAFREAKVERYL